MRFLHCSDVHVTQDYSSVPFLRLGWRRWFALAELKFGGRELAYQTGRQTLAQICRDGLTHAVDHLIVSGDLTAYAMEAEYRAAKEILKPWCEDKRRCTLVPGNHDTYTPGSRRTRRFEKYFGAVLESDLPEYVRDESYPVVRFVGEDSAVVGLCSARIPPVPGLSYGVIGKAQLSGLRDAVNDSRLKHRAILVVVHHAPLGVHGKEDRLTHGLYDARKLFEIVRGPRFAVLHGHIHRRYHHPASATQPYVFGAGSSTLKGREGYWIIETGDGLVRRATQFLPGSPEEILRVEAG